MPDDFTSTVSLSAKGGAEPVVKDDDGERFIRGALWATPFCALLWALIVFTLWLVVGE